MAIRSVELVAPDGRAVQPDPRRAGIGLTAWFERGSWTWWQFIGDDQPVTGSQRGDIVLSGDVCRVTPMSIIPRASRAAPICPAFTPRKSLMRLPPLSLSSALRSTQDQR